jgi:hypothetical protein
VAGTPPGPAAAECNRKLRNPGAEIVERQESIMNGIHSFSYKSVTSCNRDEGLDRTRLDESANDFFGTEDLLSQSYEDSVHVGMVALSS